MEIEIIAEGLHGGNGGELSVGQIKPRPHPVTQALDGGAEEMIEEFSPLAEDAAQRFGHGEDELPVRHVKAEDTRDPIAGLTHFSLMATRTEVPCLAGEGEEALVPAVRTLEPRESGGEVAAAMELADNGYGVVAEWTMDVAVALLVACFEVGPAAVDKLPQR
jgi:hypothetical protein